MKRQAKSYMNLGTNVSCMGLDKRKFLMKTVRLISLHSRKLNSCVNEIHGRAQRPITIVTLPSGEF